MEKVLLSLQKNFPNNDYRISSSSGRVQKRYKNTWLYICSHDKPFPRCKECGGGSFCYHEIRKENCKECNGKNVCIHHILRPGCKTCKGKAICEHEKQRTYCKKCKGGAICEHEIPRSRCKECGGSAYCDDHGKLKYQCKECKGSQICDCGKYRKIENNLCNHCNPDFVFCDPKYSKLACKVIDSLEKELNITIQHKHLDIVKKEWSGDEYRPLKWQRKPVDGFYLENEQETIIEFLGDYFHGHPTRWGSDEDNINATLGILFKDLFAKTEDTLIRLKLLGYRVFYIWENDYKNRKTLDSLSSICREFDNKLLY